MVLSQTHGGQNGGRWQLGQTGMCLPQSSDGSDRRRDMYHPIHDLGVANLKILVHVLCSVESPPLHMCVHLSALLLVARSRVGEKAICPSFSVQLSPFPRMTIATYPPPMPVCLVTLAFVDNCLLCLSDDQLTCLC